jgi:hypothetical protein
VIETAVVLWLVALAWLPARDRPLLVWITFQAVLTASCINDRRKAKQ